MKTKSKQEEQMEKKIKSLAKGNYDPKDLTMSREGLARREIINEYLAEQEEKKRIAEHEEKKQRVEKLREDIETMQRISDKRIKKKREEVTEEWVRDMHMRYGMKRALNIIEGKDDDE